MMFCHAFPVWQHTTARRSIFRAVAKGPWGSYRAAAAGTEQHRPPSATDSFRYASREEERVVRTTLHEIGTQPEEMKLSLKVYHFQELSRTSLRDAVLCRDSRYARLKEDLRTELEQLSPAQLVAAMVSSGRLRLRDKAFWWDLAKGVERHTVKTKSGAPGLQHSQLCLVLHALGKANIKLKERFYFRLLRHMVKRAELWTEFDMAWLLNAMRKRRLKPIDETRAAHRVWAKVLSNIAAYFRQKVHFISPKGVVFILYEFARQDIFPGRVIFQAARRIRPHVPELNDRALVALAVTLARFDWPERRLLKKLSAEVREPRRLVRLHPNMLTVILHAYAKLDVRDVPLLSALCSILANACYKLDACSCAMVAYSLGRLGIRGPIWTALAERIHDRVDWHPPLHLAMISHGFGKVAVREESLLQKSLPDAALASIAGFTPKHLACLLDGLTLAGCYREDLFRSALDEYIRLGSIGGRARQHMMSRVLFSAMLEQPQLVTDAPPSWQALLRRVEHAPMDAPVRPYHRELATCANSLSLNGARTRRRKGPYVVDLHVPLEVSQGGQDSAVAVQLLAEADLCPLTGQVLGPTRLRRRLLAKTKWQHLGLRRKEWLDLPDTEARIGALEAALVGRVAMRRRPITPSPS